MPRPKTDESEVIAKAEALRKALPRRGSVIHVREAMGPLGTNSTNQVTIWLERMSELGLVYCQPRPGKGGREWYWMEE